MVNKSLLIMAAGLGSRFGGEKQFVPFGSSGESLLDYSIYDALECGFDRIIIVIRKSMRSVVEMRYSELFEKHEVIFCEQEKDTLPAFFTPPESRTKPYGTSHALMSAAQFIDYPTLIINADDFYGKETFRRMSALMDSLSENQLGLAAFPLVGTLSENGAVTRGICKTDERGRLISISETTGIGISSDGLIRSDSGMILLPETPTSMNVWAVMPSFPQMAKPYFEEFFNALSEDDLKSELPLPVMIDKMLKDNHIEVKTTPVNTEWLGVTFAEDMPAVKEKIAELHSSGKYPTPLFD